MNDDERHKLTVWLSREVGRLTVINRRLLFVTLFLFIALFASLTLLMIIWMS